VNGGLSSAEVELEDLKRPLLPQLTLCLRQPKKTGAGGGFLLRRTVGVEDLMHPSLLPDIG